MSEREHAGVIYLNFSTNFAKIPYTLHTEDNKYVCVWMKVLDLSQDDEKLLFMHKTAFLANKMGIIKNHSK